MKEEKEEESEEEREEEREGGRRRGSRDNKEHWHTCARLWPSGLRKSDSGGRVRHNHRSSCLFGSAPWRRAPAQHDYACFGPCFQLS